MLTWHVPIKPTLTPCTGREAVVLMMHYGVQHLHVQRFTAKIGLTNTPSLHLFASLGFAKVSESTVFQEATLELLVAQAPHLAELWAAAAIAYERR